MSKFKIFYLLTALCTPFIQSCDKDDDTSKKVVLATIKQIDESEKDYFFLLDSEKTVFPGDKGKVTGYKAKEGQRAFVYFEESKESMPGYDYNIKLHYIENILTKPVVKMTEAMADSIGDDFIDVVQASISGGYLNLDFRMPHSGYRSHMLNLVENMAIDNETEIDYTTLEFRHNAFDDYFNAPVRYGFVCFNLGDYSPVVTGKKGIRLRVNTLNGSAKYRIIDAKVSDDKEDSIEAKNLNLDIK